MDIESKNIKVYNQIADDFSEKRFLHGIGLILLNSFGKSKMILDIGCGNGKI